MLDALRRGSTGLIAKLLLGLLILSFAVWGIADVFTGFSRGAVATVGDAKISVTDYDRVLRAEIDGLAAETDRRLTMEDARKQGIDRLVLSKMIGQTALKEYAREINLGLSSDRVVQNLFSDPGFAGPDGKFSRTGFNDLLSRLGMSESMFLALRLDDDLRQQFSSAVLGATVVPQAMIDIENTYKNETRDIAFFKIDTAAKVTPPEPDDAKLQTYYNDNKASFMTPEYRKYNVLVAMASDLKKDVVVTDEELKASYESEKETYDTPEKRRVQQIAFKDKAAAEAARDALVKGTKNFMDVAKDNGAKESDVNLGLVAKTQLIDPKIADAAFKIARDDISEVIEGRFATVLIRVIEISPGRESTFEETKEKVRDKLATAKATTVLQEKVDLVEEGRNAGKTKKQIADELKLRLIEVAAGDSTGKSPEGNTVLDIPTPEFVTRLVARTEPGTLTDPVEIGSDGYAWVEVLGIDPPKEKPFDTVKAEVKTAVIDSERRTQVRELAEKLVERLKAGEEFAKVAADGGGTPDKVETVKRNMVPPGLTEEAVDIAFTLPLNGAGSAMTVDRQSRVVMQITKITPAGELPPADKDKLVTDLRRGLQNDLLIAYVASLQDRLGISINDKEVARVTGADVTAN
ncbi:MAG: peptidylprolyl isomerase [Hyphomicrobium sp. 32-62-53]|nr:MAG: peptidylprolyl isomerase [Hyphomicrobium sp. 12-62-95]OYX98693.1 MAG: peptidylprolyl isomerase [Hyphomicrobium sp. 32-62-53]